MGTTWLRLESIVYGCMPDWAAPLYGSHCNKCKQYKLSPSFSSSL